MRALRTETPVTTPELIPARNGAEVVSAEVDGDTLHVDAVSFVPGCTGEEDPDAVGFDELGRITRDHARPCAPVGDPGRLHPVPLGPGHHPRAAGPLGTGGWRRASPRATTPGSSGRRRTSRPNSPNSVVHQTASAWCTPTCGWPTSWSTRRHRCRYHRDRLRRLRLVLVPGRSRRRGVVHRDTPAGERIIADWLTGYREIGAIPAAHLELVPSFVMMRRIMLTAWIASHHDADAAIGVGGHSRRAPPGWPSLSRGPDLVAGSHLRIGV